MIRSLWALAVGAAIFGAFVAPASANPAELATCAACHDLSPAKKQVVGSPLFAIYGKKPGIEGTGFAKWDKASLDKWLKSPSAVKPGTSMMFMVKNDAQRAKIIEALAELK
ncbi:Cytochrome c2 precursor [compost metagenome]